MDFRRKICVAVFMAALITILLGVFGFLLIGTEFEGLAGVVLYCFWIAYVSVFLVFSPLFLLYMLFSPRRAEDVPWILFLLVVNIGAIIIPVAAIGSID